MNDDIPVLDALRDRLVSGIAVHGGRPRRRLAASGLAAVALVVLIVALVLAGRTGGKGHPVATHGLSFGQALPAQASATGAAGGAPAAPTTVVASDPLVALPTFPGPVSTTQAPVTGTTPPRSTTVPSTLPPTPLTTIPAATTGTPVDLGRSDSGRTLTVAPGTTIDVNLVYDGTQCGMAWSETASSDNAVLVMVSGGKVGPNDQATFRAASPGTARLTATGAPYSTAVGVACPMLAMLWSVTVTVS